MKTKKNIEWSIAGKNILQDFLIKISDEVLNIDVNPLYYHIDRVQFIVTKEEKIPINFGTCIYSKKWDKVKFIQKDKISFTNINENFIFEISPYLDEPTNINVNIFLEKSQNHEDSSIFIFFVNLTNQSIKSVEFNIGTLYNLDKFGFFITDKELLNRRVLEKFDTNKVDLIENFMEDDFVDELADKGELITVWGIKPSLYRFIVKSTGYDIKMGQNIKLNGKYKLSEEAKNLSIIPSYEFRDWNECFKKTHFQFQNEQNKTLEIETIVSGGATIINWNTAIITTFLISLSKEETSEMIVLEDILPQEIYEQNYCYDEYLKW